MLLSKILIDLCTIKHCIVTKKFFCHYCLQSFSSKEIIKRHGNDCVEINLKQVNKIPKKVELLNFKKMKGN